MSARKQLDGDSLRRQVELAQAYCATHGLELDDSMHDLGFSAFDGSHLLNGSLGVFMDRIGRNEIPRNSILLVESLDRLSRDNVLDAYDGFRKLLKAGVRIVTLADDHEYSEASIKENWTQLIISLAIMSRAHEESVRKAERLREAWAGKRTAAAGEKLTARCPSWLVLNPDRKDFTENRKRVEIVQRMFEEFVGGIGKGTIAKRLNANVRKAILDAGVPHEAIKDKPLKEAVRVAIDAGVPEELLRDITNWGHGSE